MVIFIVNKILHTTPDPPKNGVFVFKHFGSFPTNRNYDETIFKTQDTVSNVWADFIKTGEISGWRIQEFRNGHCFIALNYAEVPWMVCAARIF